MKSSWILFVIISLFLALPGFSESFGTGLVQATVAFSSDEKDLFPEGIAYDSRTEQFFLSSISKEKIVAIDRFGKCSDFVPPRGDGLLRSLGLKVDARRRRLWAVSNSDWGDAMVSAVHVYDIDSRKLVKRLFTVRGKTPTFNDLVLMADGDAYISDVAGNSIYRVPPGLDRVELFLHSDTLLAGANGLAASADETFLYVASETAGIMLLDLKNKTVQPLSNRLGADCRGIDGLLLHRNSLIGILNGDRDAGRHCIVRYALSPDGREIIAASLIDWKNPLFAEPTTAVIVGDDLYCLAATFLRQFTLEAAADAGRLGKPLVLKYDLRPGPKS